MSLKDTDFLYISARIRVLENALLSAERCNRLIDAGENEELSVLAETGILPKSGLADIEAMLEDWIRQAFDTVRSDAPHPEVFACFAYPYDCANIKTAIKAYYAGKDAEPLLFSFGTIAKDTVLKAVKDKDFSAFPSGMAEAAAEAFEDFARTRDPQRIDLPLDRACLSDMLRAAAPEPFTLSLVKMRIDLNNILTAARVINAKLLPSPAEIMERAMAEGGGLSKRSIIEAASEGRTSLARLVYNTGYSNLSKSLDEGASFAVLEAVCDGIYINKVREAKRISFGPAIVSAYLSAKEFDAKNLRLILSLKRAGATTDTIRGKVRPSCV